MKYNKTKLSASLLAGAAMLSASLTTQASEVVHSGTNCEAANLDQAFQMSWNKDGVTNNSTNNLFVICPVDVDQNDWDGTPSLQIGVTIWMPPGYGVSNAPGPFCVGRSGTPNTGTPPTDNQDFQSTAFNVGNFDGDNFPGGDGDSDTNSIILNALSSSNTRSAHLLCLLPRNGGTLQTYRGLQF